MKSTAIVKYSNDEILKMDQGFRRNLINSISGFKGVHLIGTANKDGLTNLSVFNSVVHIGANPPLMGIIVRPTSVPRHTLDNIRATKYFTINHIHHDIYRDAHQAAAHYNVETSEFEKCRLTPEFSRLVTAPYVKECRIKIGLKLQEEHHIKANNTTLVIGAVIEVIMPEKALEADGLVNAEREESMLVLGLDSYHTSNKIGRLSYARPDTPTKFFV